MPRIRTENVMTTTRATPLQAIRAHCLWCMGGHEETWEMIDGTIEPPYRPFKAVEDCPSTACRLHAFRGGRVPKGESPLTSVRDHCFSCLGGLGESIRLGGRTYTRARPSKLISRCQRTDCALFPFRHGKRAS